MNSVPSPPKELKHTHAQKHTHTHTHQQQTTDNGVCCQIHITHCLIPSCCLIAAGVSMRSGPQRCSQHATLDQSLRNSLIPKSITFSLFHTFSDTFQNRKGKSNPRCGWFAALPIHPTQLTPHNSHPTHAVSATAFVAVGSDKQNTSCSQAERLCMRLAFGTRCLKAVPNSTTAAATQQERPRPHNKER